MIVQFLISSVHKVLVVPQYANLQSEGYQSTNHFPPSHIEKIWKTIFIHFGNRVLYFQNMSTNHPLIVLKFHVTIKRKTLYSFCCFKICCILNSGDSCDFDIVWLLIVSLFSVFIIYNSPASVLRVSPQKFLVITNIFGKNFYFDFQQ